MRDGRGRRLARATRAEAGVLALACTVAGLFAGFTAAVPFSPTAPTGLNLVFLVLGTLLGAVLWWWRDRLPAVAAHGAVVLATLCVTGAVAASTTPAGVAVTSLGTVWVSLFSAVFHRRRALVAHLTLVLGGLAGALVHAGAMAPLQTWAFVGVTTCVVAAVVHRYVTRLRERADHDPLTGALTRTAFRARAEQAMGAASRRGEPLTLVLLDLDDFKQVNDSGGHAAGDRLLAELAHCWRAGITDRDLLGRHGGDEFVLLLDSGTLQVAREVLGRLRATATAGSWTAGIAVWSGQGFEAWLAEADADLYRRKVSRPTR